MQSPKNIIPLSAVKDTAKLSKLIVAGVYVHEIEEVCAALRYSLKDLFPKTVEDFAEEGISMEVAEIRFQHYEKKRQYRLSKILRELANPQSARRNRSQDLTKMRKAECCLLGPCNRYGGQSVSPSSQDLPPSPREYAEVSLSDTLAPGRKRSKTERIMQAQERSLQLRLAEFKEKINKLKLKESRYEHAKEELRAAEAEKQRKLELHNAKVRETLEKRYKALEAFEKREARRALTHTPDPKLPSHTPIPVTSSKSQLDEEDLLEKQMKHIEEKLLNGAARASQFRTLKVLAQAAKHDSERKAKERVRAEETSKELELLRLAQKLQEQQSRSQRLREQHLQTVLEKMAHKRKFDRPRHRQSVHVQREDTHEESDVEKAKLELLKHERAKLKRMDVQENLMRERNSLQEMKESILHKHQHLASTVDRRLTERSSQHQSLLKEDFQRQVQRERLKDEVNGQIQELHSRFLRTIDI